MVKKVLITGSTGMVGRSLLSKLSGYSELELITPSRMEMDLLNEVQVKQFVASHKPDCIIHLAAKVGGIQANINQPVDFLSQNLTMGLNIVLGALSNGVQHFINIASSCMYPKDREVLKEEDILTGSLEPTNEGYALAKISVLKLCQYINQQYGYQYKTLVPSNLYGPFDNFDLQTGHLIPAMLHKIHLFKCNQLEKIVIWGDGLARREFLYVDDFTNFLVLNLNKIAYLPNIINVGHMRDYTVNEYYQVAAKVIGVSMDFYHDLSKPVGMKKKLLDSNKAKKLGWFPKTSLETGLKKTYQYFLETYEKAYDRN